MFLLRWRRTIRSCLFRYQSLEICYFYFKIKDSRHFQPAMYTVFHAESESAVRIDQFLHPEEKIKKNQPTRVSISYRKISYHTSPPYLKPIKQPIFLRGGLQVVVSKHRRIIARRWPKVARNANETYHQAGKKLGKRKLSRKFPGKFTFS